SVSSMCCGGRMGDSAVPDDDNLERSLEPAARAESDTHPVEPGPLQQLLERLTAVEDQLGEFHRRSAHREAVIDRLHAENQELRAGLWRAILEPAVADLIRLHDGLGRE